MPDHEFIQNIRPSLALNRFGIRKLPIGLIVGLADDLRQPAIDKLTGLAAEFLAPCAIFGLRIKHLAQTGCREVVAPR